MIAVARAPTIPRRTTHAHRQAFDYDPSCAPGLLRPGRREFRVRAGVPAGAAGRAVSAQRRVPADDVVGRRARGVGHAVPHSAVAGRAAPGPDGAHGRAGGDAGGDLPAGGVGGDLSLADGGVAVARPVRPAPGQQPNRPGQPPQMTMAANR